MYKRTLLPVMVTVTIILIMIAAITYTNEQMKGVVLNNELLAKQEMISNVLPDGEEFSLYTQETVTGINDCYIETRGFGMVTESVVSAENIEFTILVGINQNGVVSGIDIIGDEFDGSFYKGIINDEYLLGYLGVQELTEESIEDDSRFEQKKDAMEISESIYQTVKVALKQYGEIYE